jgi:hypothetical protein
MGFKIFSPSAGKSPAELNFQPCACSSWPRVEMLRFVPEELWQAILVQTYALTFQVKRQEDPATFNM